MEEVLKKKQQLRLAFLKKVYEMTKGDTRNLVNGAEVAHQIGLKDGEEDQALAIINFLDGEGLIIALREIRGIGSVRLSHAGLREIEDAIMQPDRPTKHFMPINILSVGQMIGSTIQQGSIGSHQAVNIGSEDLEHLRAFIEQLSHSLDEFKLEMDSRNELNAEVATVKAQLSSPKPKASILREGLRSIERILEGAVASAVGVQLANKIPVLLSFL